MASASRSSMFRRLCQRAARLGRDRNGLSAVEFALILPLMLGLYVGAVELCHGLTIDRRITTMASSVADLVAQADSISDAELLDVFEAASSVLTPYSDDALTIVVTSVKVDEDSDPTVDWSAAHNATAHAPGSSYPLPTGLIEPKTSVIIAEVTYLYNPAISENMAGGITLSETFYVRPRRVTSVEKL